MCTRTNAGDKCRQLGLPSGGKKEVLINRLLQNRCTRESSGFLTCMHVYLERERNSRVYLEYRMISACLSKERMMFIMQ
jgi:hypothetical protein